MRFRSQSRKFSLMSLLRFVVVVLACAAGVWSYATSANDAGAAGPGLCAINEFAISATCTSKDGRNCPAASCDGKVKRELLDGMFGCAFDSLSQTQCVNGLGTDPCAQEYDCIGRTNGVGCKIDPDTLVVIDVAVKETAPCN